MANNTSPQTSPFKGPQMSCKVLMLDDTIQLFSVPVKSCGQVLFDAVASKLQLQESDYFGLQYSDPESIPCWLDNEKSILSQIRKANLNLKFLVKFYSPDPGLLEEELTRYLYALQIKRDLLSGELSCQEHTAVLLASYIVQAEVGNYCEGYVSQAYVSTLQLLPNQTPEIELQIIEHHREHIGQTPAEADFNLLDTARKVEFYGIQLHQAQDHEGINLHLAVSHSGLHVFQNYMKINSFSWAKIRKLCFKRRKFLVKLHQEGSVRVDPEFYKDTVEFYFLSRNWSKTFWKKCIEHHSFFRCHSVKRGRRSKPRVISHGSSFRYCGRTQKELLDYARENCRKPTPFERSTSLRTMSALHSRAGSPKTGTLNSCDLHFGCFQASNSSGSRTLDRSSQDNATNLYRLSTNDQHSSPPNYHDAYKLRQMQSPSSTASPGHGMSLAAAAKSNRNHTTNGGLARPLEVRRSDDPGYSVPTKLDPAQFMLTTDGRTSVPTVTEADVNSGTIIDDEYPVLSPEVEDIPEVIQTSGANGTCVSGTPLKSQEDAVLVTSDMFPPPPGFAADSPLEKPQTSDDFRNKSLLTGTSAMSAISATLTSNVSFRSSHTDDSEDDGKRRRNPVDRTFYLAKELLMTERTYKKDLEVIVVWFRDAMMQNDVMPDYLTGLFFGSIVRIYEFHSELLRDLELRVSAWEGKAGMNLANDLRKVGDLLFKLLPVMQQWYRIHFEHHQEILCELDRAAKQHDEFNHALNEFESQKVCYLPLHAFLLKPAQRLVHYRLLLARFLSYYDSSHPDVKDCQSCLDQITEILDTYRENLAHLENWQKLIELQRGLVGIDSLVQPHRTFVREGCLQKLSRRGCQQRMFFLFSDMLIYTNCTANPLLQFKVHGQLSLTGMVVDELNTKNVSVNHSFAIYGQNRTLVVAASSHEEKLKWLEDLHSAIFLARGKQDDVKVLYPSLKSTSSSEALEDSREGCRSPSSPDRQSVMQHCANTTMHVCWHRSTSISMKDHCVVFENQLSGYLLRKFKTSNGWQKLWVIFTNFCLFFYKNFQDDFPLASLPLLGYTITHPDPSDLISKEFVFKLQFKNHVYFFRAESQPTFDRWTEVIGRVTATVGSVGHHHYDLPPPPQLLQSPPIY